MKRLLLALYALILSGCAGIPDADTNLPKPRTKAPCEIRGTDEDGQRVCVRRRELEEVLRDAGR